MDIVEEHLIKWRRSSFKWGKSDCMLAIADYLEGRFNIDCASHYRGKYNSRASCRELTNYNGNIIRVFESGVAKIGLATTDNPVRGDVGIIEVEECGKQIEIAALCLGDGFWGIRALRGVIITKTVKLIKGWSV